MATSLSTCRLPPNMIYWAHSSPQHKRHLDRYSCFCTAHCRMSLCFTMGLPFSHSKLPILVGDPDPNLIHGSAGPPDSTSQTASRSVEPFLHGSHSVRDRQTDQPTDHTTRSVTIGHMRPNNTTLQPYTSKQEMQLLPHK